MSHRGGGYRGFRPRNRGFGHRGGPIRPHWQDRNKFQQPFGNQGAYRGNYHIPRFPGNKPYVKPTRDTPGTRLSENEVGITEYVSPNPGFNGIIKTRYSDFHVSEINEAGQVAILTDQSVPTLPEKDDVQEDDEELLSKYDLELLPIETWDKINLLAIKKNRDAVAVDVEATNMSKEDRTKIHEGVKKAFGMAIVGSTVNTDDGKKFLHFDRPRKGVRIDKRVKWLWPGTYLHFIVHKENCDTMEAAVKIADRLKINLRPSMIGYAGTKDRRAKTSQWFSLRKVTPEKVASACEGLREIHVGNFEFKTHHIQLGMLQGNKFRIALRNVTAEDSLINARCAEMRDSGFINYYGLQRFGTRYNVPTHQIGARILQSKFREAVKLILSPREGPLQQALHLYSEGNVQAAWGSIPNHARGSVEARLLETLARNTSDYNSALGRIPRNTRLLYIHAYQSLIWNLCVTERLKRFGLKVAVGDLVPVDNVPVDVVDDVNENDDEADDGHEDLPKDQEIPKDEEKYKKPRINVRVLTQEDVDSNGYTVFDVVMPLPGFDVVYPPNMLEHYEKLMKKDDLQLDLRHKIKTYSLSGTYRLMVVRPKDFSWQSVKYVAPHSELIISDLDELRGQNVTGIVDEGKYKALLLTMTLPASCYATMALRELLKIDTSSDFQAQQNNYHKEGTAAETEDRKRQHDGEDTCKSETDAKKVKSEGGE